MSAGLPLSTFFKKRGLQLFGVCGLIWTNAVCVSNVTNPVLVVPVNRWSFLQV